MTGRARQWLSSHASLCLVILVIPIGITTGLGLALEKIASQRSGRVQAPVHGTRPGSREASAACAHAVLDFEASATASSIKDLLLSLDARVIYGPDEFGRFQVRLASGATGQGMDMLRTSGLVMQLENYPECV